MTDDERFELVSWGTGGAVYDHRSGSTHLLDEIAVLLLENRFSHQDEAIALVCSVYPDESPELVRQHVAEGYDALQRAGLL
jgi:hypothetical protein